MTDRMRCPACQALLGIPPGSVPGSMIQCPGCAAKLAVPESRAVRGTEARKVAPAVREPDEEPARRPKKLKRPRPRPRSSGPLLGLIIGLGLLFFVCAAAGVTIYVISINQGPPQTQQQAQDQQPWQPGPGPGPNHPGPQDPPPAAGQQLITLSNGKFYDSIRGPTFEVDVALSGNLRMGTIKYYLVVKDPNGQGFEVGYLAIELSRQKTLRMVGLGPLGRGGSGYEAWIEERPIGAFRGEGNKGTRVSNSIALQRTEPPRGPFGAPGL